MAISTIIFYISTIVWLLPPLKQFRGKFFSYFLLQALSDPVTHVLLMLGFYSMPVYLVKNLLQILFLWEPKNFRLKILYTIPVLIFMLYAASLINDNILGFILAVAHTVLLYIIFRMASDDVIEHREIKIFYVLLILYEVTAVMKYIFKIIEIHTGYIYFLLISALEILLCFFFIFIREDNKRFAIPIKERTLT